MISKGCNAVCFVALLLSLHTPANASRIAIQANLNQVHAHAKNMSSELSRHDLQYGSFDQSQMLAEATGSQVCYMFRTLASFCSDRTRSSALVAFFDANSGDVIVGHLSKILSSMQGIGIHHVTAAIGAFSGMAVTIIGALWSITTWFATVCESTLGTCAGIVATVGLLLTMFSLTLLFVPAVSAYIWAAVGLAGTGHLGAMSVAILNVGIRHLLRNICSMIMGAKELNVRGALADMRSQASEISTEVSSAIGTSISVAHVESAFDKVASDSVIAMSYKRVTANRTGFIAELQIEADRAAKEWQYTTEDWGRLTKENKHKYVDEHEFRVD